MDGNGRWAQGKGLARVTGHERGAEAVRDSVAACCELGVEYLTLYAFSTENWKRPRAEISALMTLLERFLASEVAQLHKQGVRLIPIGRLGDLPASTRKRLAEVTAATAGNKKLTLVLALSYSSRVEIVDAVQALARDVQAGRLAPEAITPEALEAHLYTAGIPDPDLVIRTSGEMRLSNFLLWQASYSELYVTPTLWPDFRKSDLFAAVRDFGGRQRRFGAISP